MTSPDCLSTNSLRPHLASKSRPNLPIPSVHNVTEELKKTSFSTLTPTSTSPNLFHTPMLPNQLPLSQTNKFNFPGPPHAPGLARRTVQFKPPEQDVLDDNFFAAFNMGQQDGKNNNTSENKPATGSTFDQTRTEDPNLIDMGVDPPSTRLPEGNVFELFDPLQQQQTSRPYSWPSTLNPAEPKTATPPFVTPNGDTPPILPKVSPVPSPSIPSSAYPYPIKLRLKLTTFPEIKPFSQLVQQIQNEKQTKQVPKMLLHSFLLDISSAPTSLS